ncbi:MAG TPA: restriction system-associated AAA family ATPase [Bacteroidia bacterium]|jgi:restriction system-associated AAA family ATPase|nr:restriction system-associated AAA family ATPase [Bacteroidia bacterium]
MKLVSVKILGEDFRSLANNKLYKFNEGVIRKDRLSSKVFAGLNGSGKSNFLELLAEIFFYLEKYHLKSVSTSEKRAKNIGFEIEYILPIDSLLLGVAKYNFKDGCHVRIIKQLDELPEFSFKKYGGKDFIRLDDTTEFLLPTKVIAYTSGQNELLSNPFHKIKYHYFKELQKVDPQNNAVSDRLFFLDNSSNFSIFVANMLLASPAKMDYVRDIFKIEDLHSFRITINLVDYKKYKFHISDEIQSYIDRLKQCATTWINRQKEREDIIILDYSINQATHDAFKFHFNTSFELFKAFYELDSLNLHLVAKDTRSLMLKAHKSLNISDELPKPDPSRLIFRIEKINLNKIVEEGKPSKEIYYKGLSDGEHQFNEVIGSVMMMEEEGCLFLMDEPDTHFNPIWRAKMIEMLNFVAATKFEKRERYKVDPNNKIILAKNKKPVKEKYLYPSKVRRHEIIITTHSPFVISDSQSEDVYKFDKVNGEVVYVNPKIETYGASVSLLLQEIFDRRISISDLSNYDLGELRNMLRELKRPTVLKATIEEIKAKLTGFGESIEKFDLYSLLNQIEKDIKKK